MNADTEILRAVLESVENDDDVGNTIVRVILEPGVSLGFTVERVIHIGEGALSVFASRRALAARALNDLDRQDAP